MSKLKILWHSDCSVSSNSGFGKVSLELLNRLSATNKYEIAELGLGNPEGQGYKQEPNWKIYTSGEDQYSEDKFVPIVEEFKPDVVISLLDVHMNSFINDNTIVPIKLRNTFKAVTHVPIDGAPLPINWLKMLAGFNYIVPIHEFGFVSIRNEFVRQITKLRAAGHQLIESRSTETAWVDKQLELIKLHIGNYSRALASMKTINHGVDLSTYYPCSPERKAEIRSKFNINKDAFVFTYVGRNSVRKQQPLALQAFKEVVRKYPNSVLVLGCKNVDVGWNLTELIDRLGINGKVIITNNSSDRATEGLTNEEIADIYRMSDCFISTCIGGGFELCHLESAACGLPQIGVDGAGSITDMVKGNGLLVNADKYWLGGMHGPFERPLVKPTDFANAMKNMIRDDKKRDAWSKSAIAFANKPEFSWDFAAKEFEGVIEEVMKDESVAIEGMHE